MIKFFRKIRYELMDKNKNGRYFKYAIGEIILVVIGILIALQINNWNEKRKLSNDIESTFIVFEKELESNIEKSNSLIDYGYRIDSITTLYVNNKITRNMILSNYRLYYLNFNTSTRKFLNDNLDVIIALEKQLSKKYVTLIPELKELKRRIESQRKWEQAAIDISMSRYKEMTDELPWYHLRDSLSIEKKINHYLTDSIYKSKILHFNNYQLDENVWDATLIRTSSVVLLWKIKNLKSNAPASIEEFLNNLGLTSFQVYNCGKQPLEKIEEINFYTNFVFYNNTRDTIYYNYINKKGDVLNRREIRLAPKSFRINEFTLGTNNYIQLVKNDTCRKVYGRTKESYLVIN